MPTIGRLSGDRTSGRCIASPYAHTRPSAAAIQYPRPSADAAKPTIGDQSFVTGRAGIAGAPAAAPVVPPLALPTLTMTPAMRPMTTTPRARRKKRRERGGSTRGQFGVALVLLKTASHTRL